MSSAWAQSGALKHRHFAVELGDELRHRVTHQRMIVDDENLHGAFPAPAVYTVERFPKLALKC
jgi:hypothetical protein